MNIRWYFSLSYRRQAFCSIKQNSDENFIKEMLPNAEIYFDPNQYGKKMKKKYKKVLSSKTK